MTDHRFIYVRDMAMRNFLTALDEVDMSDGDRTKLKHAARGAVSYAYGAGENATKADLRELLDVAGRDD